MNNAIRFGTLILLKQLVKEGHSVHKLGNKNGTYLHNAALWSTPETIKYFVDCGVDPNHANIYQQTPLHVASFWGKTENVETLIDNGAKLDSTNLNGWTALHLAVQKDRVEVIRLLLATGKFNNQKSLIHTAAWENSIKSLELLLNKFPIDELDYNYKTPFQIAVENNRPVIAQMLLDKGAKLVVPNIQGESILHHSVRWNQIDLLRLYLDAGIDPNLKNQWGQTLLHVAVNHTKLSIIQLLLEKGADVQIKDEQGDSPLDIIEKGLSYRDDKFEQNRQYMSDVLNV